MNLGKEDNRPKTHTSEVIKDKEKRTVTEH